MDSSLTGITTTGTPHLGNYVGAIKPAIELSKKFKSYLFLADYHSLIKVNDPEAVKESSMKIAASWLACGLDSKNSLFYRQSKVPQILELNWILSCMAPKGLLNRAHAYKAAVDLNKENKNDDDYGISHGLFSYPVLMSADILMFNPKYVPVGKDQKQHLEITRDIADKFNKTYKIFFQLPEPIIDESLDLLTGTDGRKMSKSYNNSIDLFSSEKVLQKSINKIKTDSKEPGEKKETKDSIIFQYFNHFSDEKEIDEIKKEFEDGIGWGDAKKKLFTKINQEISPLRDKYFELIDNPKLIEDTLEAGETLAREEANKNLEQIKEKIGI